MKKTTVLCLLLLYFFSACTKPGYRTYPSYKTVYTHFYQTYSVKNLEDISQLQFQKKPDGWHVVVLKHNTVDTIIKDELFWKRGTETFQEIGFTKASYKNENKEQLDRFWRDTKAESFNLFPYYNYKGFDWDIIQDYQGMNNLPDSILYALGRSYSYYADNLLNDNSGFSNKKVKFDLKDGPNSLSPDQLEKYKKYHDLSIETYKKVQKLNPKYETIVGDIGLKLGDEYMVAYLDMMIYQNETEANKELKDNIFDYFMVSFAKNYLTSCDSNAILITYGDNDTYPLLYVQAKYHFRTDVLIVNSSLLETSTYINRMRRPFAGAQPLPLSIRPEQYKDGVLDFVVFNTNSSSYSNNSDNYEDLKSAMDFILSDDPSHKIDAPSGDKLSYLSTKQFKLSVNPANVVNSKILHGESINNIAPEIKWSFQGSYILKDKLILLNVLLNNDWKRPICFAIGGGADEFAGLDNYLRLQGFVYELVPFKNPSGTSYSNADISTADMYNTVMHKFQWGNMGNGVPLNKGKIYMAEISRVVVGELAQALIAEGKKDSAIKVLDFCSDSIPEKSLPFENDEMVLDEAYYAAGGFDKANTISKKLFDIYEGKLIEYSKPDPEDHYRESNLNEAKNFILRLRYDAQKYKQDGLQKIYDAKLKDFISQGLINQEEIINEGSN